MNKRGQAAMEFLMTYGWAILVVLIAIGALAYFGVLNPGRFLPNSCTVAPGIGCDDFKVTTDSVQLFLRNGMGDDLQGVSLRMDGPCGTEESVFANHDNSDAGNDIWLDGTILGDSSAGLKLLNCDNGAVGTRFKEDINLTYNTSSGIRHQRLGLLTTRVEEALI